MFTAGVGDSEGEEHAPDEITLTPPAAHPGSNRDNVSSSDDELGGMEALNGAGDGGGVLCYLAPTP